MTTKKELQTQIKEIAKREGYSLQNIDLYANKEQLEDVLKALTMSNDDMTALFLEYAQEYGNIAEYIKNNFLNSLYLRRFILNGVKMIRLSRVAA